MTREIDLFEGLAHYKTTVLVHHCVLQLTSMKRQQELKQSHEHKVYQHLPSPPFTEVSKTTPKHLQPRKRQTMPNLAYVTKIYLH